jgi:hypothetical protein
MLNAFLWLVMAFGVKHGVQVTLLLFFAVSPPIAWLFVLPTLGNRSPSAGATLVVACIMIGVNSFLWGYGLSWLWSKVAGTRSSAPRELIHQELQPPP